jgi:hypothetical protein
MRFLLALILFVLFKISFSQELIPYTAMSVDGINIRNTPDIDGEIITKLPFGSVLFSKPIKQKKLTKVNGINGYWLEVSNKGYKGYAFSPYLYRGELVKQDLNSDAVIMLREGLLQGMFGYHPSLNWFGIYRDSLGFTIKKVKLDFKLSKVIGDSLFNNYDCTEDDNILLKTNEPNESLFLIGMFDSIPEGKLFYDFFNDRIGYSSDNGFLYPEQKRRINYLRRAYYLRAYDSLSTDRDCNIEKKYQIEYTIHDYKTNSYTHINISDSLSIKDSGEKHSKYFTPKIYWIGDIDSDGLLDVIFYQHSMVDHGGVTWTYRLFNTIIEEDKFYLKEIAGYSIGSCH